MTMRQRHSYGTVWLQRLMDWIDSLEPQEQVCAYGDDMCAAPLSLKQKERSRERI